LKYRKTVECVIGESFYLLSLLLPVINFHINIIVALFVYFSSPFADIPIRKQRKNDSTNPTRARVTDSEKCMKNNFRRSQNMKFASISFSELFHFHVKTMPIIASRNKRYLNIDLVIDQLVNIVFVFSPEHLPRFGREKLFAIVKKKSKEKEP
jgi:hypothetical protein